MVAAHMKGSIGDPPAGFDTGSGPPEAKQRERTELASQFITQAVRRGIAIRQLAAISQIHRARRDADIGAGVHRVPPEQVGTGKAGSRCFAASQTFSPCTSRLDWRHSIVSPRSRKCQPFATIPWPAGGSPVSMVLWAEHVTAGRIACNGRMPDRAASRFRCGRLGPSRRGVRPGTLTTITGRITTGSASGRAYGGFFAISFLASEWRGCLIATIASWD